MSTEILTLDEIAESQANKYLTHNTALRQIEAKTIRVLSRTTTAEPVSPSAGDTYLIPASATGTNWAGEDGKIGHFYNGSWQFYNVFEGLTFWVNDEDSHYAYNGTSWIDFSTLYGGAASSVSTTNYTIEETGGNLIFKNGVTTIASLDASGNLTVLGNVVSNTAP